MVNTKDYKNLMKGLTTEKPKTAVLKLNDLQAKAIASIEARLLENPIATLFEIQQLKRQNNKQRAITIAQNRFVKFGVLPTARTGTITYSWVSKLGKDCSASRKVEEKVLANGEKKAIYKVPRHTENGVVEVIKFVDNRIKKFPETTKLVWD